MSESAESRYYSNVHETMLLIRRLALYLHSGIPLVRSLALMIEDARDTRILVALSLSIGKGRTLADALAQHPRAFPSYAIAIVRAGEASGTLARSLAQLAGILEARRALHAKIMGALAYPMIIVVATIGITSFLVLYAFPKIVPVFRGFHAVLPFSTRALLWFTDFCTQYGLYLFGLLSILSAGTVFLLRKPQVRMRAERLLLSLPLFGPLFVAYHIAQLARMLSMLLGSGMRIVPALALAEGASMSPTYRSALARSEQRVIQGMPLSEALVGYETAMPSFARQMIAAGEMTGSLAESFTIIAETYETDLDERSRMLASLIEPALMLVVGLVVGFVALAIITPLYRITQDLSLH